jgi:hypothetical protein
MEVSLQKTHLHTHSSESLFIIAKLGNQTRCPTIDEWIKSVVYICNGVLKKNEIMPFAGKWMELEIIMLNEISQAPKAK